LSSYFPVFIVYSARRLSANLGFIHGLLRHSSSLGKLHIFRRQLRPSLPLDGEMLRSSLFPLSGLTCEREDSSAAAAVRRNGRTCERFLPPLFPPHGGLSMRGFGYRCSRLAGERACVRFRPPCRLLRWSEHARVWSPLFPPHGGLSMRGFSHRCSRLAGERACVRFRPPCRLLRWFEHARF